VALARMYRGMHHPLDVAGGLIIGIGALLVLLFACRAAGVAQEARSSRAARSAPRHRAERVA
jgi:membrane-associated phospholipid phosphatase